MMELPSAQALLHNDLTYLLYVLMIVVGFAIVGHFELMGSS